jgi:hypothetical protein
LDLSPIRIDGGEGMHARTRLDEFTYGGRAKGKEGPKLLSEGLGRKRRGSFEEGVREVIAEGSFIIN